MHLRLIRHATVLLHVAGRRVLVDPMLDPAGARPPVESTPNPRRNPLVDLPEPPEVVVSGIDAALITHLHADHFDETAARLLPRELPLLVQPPDEAPLRERGFSDVRPVDDELVPWEGAVVARTPARHGRGEIAERLAPVSGFVITGEGEPTLYLAGDTVWGEEVRGVLDAQEPDVVVVNAGGARFLEGDPIVMTAEDVVAVARAAPQARVVVVHLEAINHCLETRSDLHQRLSEEGLQDQVTVPEDGAEVPVMPVGG
jgi:L-ascorbate metabolism protein UlaG (beta-lactamase superfamily)